MNEEIEYSELEELINSGEHDDDLDDYDDDEFDDDF